MACGVQISSLNYYSFSTIVNGTDERAVVKENSDSVLHWKDKHGFCAGLSPFLSKSSRRRRGWEMVAFALNTGGLPTNGDQETTNGGIPPGLGQTRLGRLVSAGGRQLLEKLNSARKNFPMKVFLLLLGFYTANALATILGQTGDWDVLVAGVVVAAIEGIGMLMYKKSATTSNNNNNNNNSNRSKRFESLVVMINYWKAGVCLGLFVDAFKLGS
ncbi:ycf20-like protein isoform X2 [Cynara cardunculus var. scolymus]|nr:ycf20-like protein isoform X2 [Cynara cardunculus var. scolymus]